MFAKPLTLENAYNGFAAIYSRANALTTVGGRAERLAFLLLACADLSRCVRKEQAHLYPIALAQIFAWFNSLAEDLFRQSGGHTIAHGMLEKYPQGLCGYCHRNPCVCAQTRRDEHNPGLGSFVQERWSLEDWQDNLRLIYGQANEAGGVPRALNRLFEEVAEVGRLLHLAEDPNEALDTLTEKMSRELTDVLAWLFALASLLSIDLESAVIRLYDSGCPVCKEVSCECKNFAQRPGSDGIAHRFISAEEIHALAA